MNFDNYQWNKNNYNNFLKYLKSIENKNYKLFHSKIVPNINNIIGIKTPNIKKITKYIEKGDYNKFLTLNTNTYYEETLIHGLILTDNKNIDDKLLDKIYLYINNIDNWSTCDIVCCNFKAVNKNKELVIQFIYKIIVENNEWKKRFAYVLLLSYYVEEKYLEEIFQLCETYNSDNYYVQMSVAWLISVCYIRYSDITMKFIKNNKLNDFTHNKAIQKIIESKRSFPSEKILLNKLKK